MILNGQSLNLNWPVQALLLTDVNHPQPCCSDSLIVLDRHDDHYNWSKCRP